MKILTRHRDLLHRRTGMLPEIVAVSAKSRTKDRGIDISRFQWEDDPVALAQREDIDVVVELIGGEDGPAREAIETALVSGKDVVTANKAMLAIHGQRLAELAEDNGRTLRFEAAVAGGIPVVKALTESLAANEVRRIMGVLNGTCNYILTRMESERLTYDEVFAEAEALGYLESDPKLDVGGIDAGHKLALLAAIAYGTRVDFASLELEGIERISIVDIEQARDMGFRVKLLGTARMSRHGLEQSIRPCLVPAESPLGQIEGATNIVVIDGDSSGPIFLRGAGAGELPTASAVVSDIADIARGSRVSTFGQAAASLSTPQAARTESRAPYYLRLLLVDAPGVLAKIASALGEAGVSINRMRQYGHEDEAAPVIMVTHKTSRTDLEKAIAGIKESGVALSDPVAIRIEEI